MLSAQAQNCSSQPLFKPLVPWTRVSTCQGGLKPPHVPMGQPPFSFYFAPYSGKLVSGLGGPPTPAACPSLLLKPRRRITTQVTLKSKAS